MNDSCRNAFKTSTFFTIPFCYFRIMFVQEYFTYKQHSQNKNRRFTLYSTRSLDDFRIMELGLNVFRHFPREIALTLVN